MLANLLHCNATQSGNLIIHDVDHKVYAEIVIFFLSRNYHYFAFVSEFEQVRGHKSIPKLFFLFSEEGLLPNVASYNISFCDITVMSTTLVCRCWYVTFTTATTINTTDTTTV